MHLYMNYFSSIDILSTFSTVINSIFLSKENIWIKHHTPKMGHKTWAAIAMDWVRLPSDRRPGRTHFPSDMQYVINGTSNYNSPKFLTPTTLSPSLSHRFSKVGSRPYEFSNQNSFGNTRFGNIEFEIWIFICKYMSTKHLNGLNQFF